ncbi:hypothetical protein C7C45_04875 [Micromonospora arborensis]|uniref:DNA recombination protein RmuC n=1 Tax=Micromonospora arborensis TaxID=2116518 RepID=A0A318NTU5_9ACTN|nr:hypothetical protein [Micromonospora arborensis]PYC75205.1 hypothetical protein C7C45_04875 [Micromonospora arborensis]
MTTTEKITLGVAIAGALGAGALIKSWVDHLLSRHDRKINIADKSVQIAESLMSRMESELTKTLDALEETQRQGERLRAELAMTATDRDELSARELKLTAQLRQANARAEEFVKTMRIIRTQFSDILDHAATTSKDQTRPVPQSFYTRMVNELDQPSASTMIDRVMKVGNSVRHRSDKDSDSQPG